MSPGELDAFEEVLFTEHAVFYPSHLTKALAGTAVAAAGGGIFLVAGIYALNQYRQVTLGEVRAMVTGS